MVKDFYPRAKEIVAGLSLKQKVGQMCQFAYFGQNAEDVKKKIREYGIGSVILCNSAFAGNSEQGDVCMQEIRELQRVAVEETPAGIPLIFGRDVIHGHTVVYPVDLAMACSFNPEFAKECYRSIATEAAKDGINWSFAPMLDFCHDPRWGRIAECQGEDPYLASKMAAAIVEGFQGEDLADPTSISACAKHYIGYGASEGGRDYNHTEISDYSLYNNYLPAFRAAAKADIGTFMCSFNEINGVPAVASRRIMTDILRGELGFDGFVVSDWGAIWQMGCLGYTDSNRKSTEYAVHAGIDMDMENGCYPEHLEQAVLDGDVPMEEVDLAVTRIVAVKLALGLFSKPYGEDITFDVDAHCEQSKRMCEESCVLLKNNGVLPLKNEGTIYLAGPFADVSGEHRGCWSVGTEAVKINTVKDVLPTVANNAEVRCLDEMTAQSVLLKEEGVIVCMLGERRAITGEAVSVSDIRISKNQVNTVKALKRSGYPVVAVICAGRPLALTELEPYCDAILYAWHGGTRAPEAICDILMGKSEPKGRLCVSLLRSSGQIPLYYNAPRASRNINEYYEAPTFTTNYVDCKGSPLYPFGFGLSYGEFSIGEIALSCDEMTLDELKSGKKVTVSAELKNIGNREGTEVAELYINDVVATRTRPMRELKGFKKETLKPGESRTVSFELGYEELGFYLETGEYVVETGKFDIYLGKSCRTDNKVTFTLK